MGKDNYDSSLPEKRRGSDYNIYKGKGTIRFSLKKSRAKSGKNKGGNPYVGTETGALFYMAAPLTGPHQYDRNKQIIMAFNEGDIGKLIHALKTFTPAQFFHDPGKGGETEGEITKTLKLKPSDDGQVLFFQTSSKTGTEVIQISAIPVTEAEAEVLIVLLERAICEILGWA